MATVYKFRVQCVSAFIAIDEKTIIGTVDVRGDNLVPVPGCIQSGGYPFQVDITSNESMLKQSNIF